MESFGDISSRFDHFPHIRSRRNANENSLMRVELLSDPMPFQILTELMVNDVSCEHQRELAQFRQPLLTSRSVNLLLRGTLQWPFRRGVYDFNFIGALNEGDRHSLFCPFAGD